MSKRRVFLLTAAAFIALVVVIVVHSSMQAPENAATATAVPTTEVLAAARDLPTGTIIKESDLKWIPWAADAETGKLYVKGKIEMSSLAGGVLREGLHSDEPIVMGRIVQPHEQGFLAAVLTPGMRAVTVTLTPSGEVAGFIFPGDHVDVILTHSFTTQNEKGENDSIERALSETVVTDARVLALDQKSDNQSTDPKVAQLATLEVTPQQAEKLALAMDMAGQASSNKGSLTLILRSLANTENINAVTDKNVPGPVLDSDMSPVYSRVTRLQRVEVMRGNNKTEAIFQDQK
jgi:pilus assembly protein CpaB